MYSLRLVASAATRGRSALQSASRLSRLGGATTAIALLISGPGIAGQFPRSLADQDSRSPASVSQPSMRVVSSLSGLGFATEFAGDLEGAVGALHSLTPRQVAALWPALPDDFRNRLVEDRPDAIGNLGGVSYVDRSSANVARLVELRDQAESDLHLALGRSASSAGDAESARRAMEATDRLRGVELLANRFGSETDATDPVPHYLIELDGSVTGPPLAAVAVGDLNTAKFTSFFVPGMDSSVLQLSDYLRGVERMQEASVDSAAVLWLGYESPGPVDTVSTGHAEAGSVRLAAALASYDAVRDAAESLAEVTVIGHSYGSTTAALALASGNYGVSSFVVIGSAGVPAGLTIADLHVRPERVYVSQAREDALADTGRFWSGRANPAEPEWGAQFFGSDGTTLADGTILAAVKAHDVVGSSRHFDHDKYLGDGTESLYDIQKIITGERHDITPGSRSIASDATLLAEGDGARP
ncbi:alpha/beta hydrolase [Mycetocola zhujimingii]|uniref:alpha/beta hydrolase n=1 Tax=Mycetocola zhujimingii TaxID=2079792 RepID=UPI0013C51F6C|nr:alpha/beta hydrolase [Mycetocola zhujimingii]